MAIINSKKQDKEIVNIFEPRKKSLHDELCILSSKWLKSIGCAISIDDRFKPPTPELPDAIGWRSGVSILIEVKTSRSDFLADKKKHFRVDPDAGMGDWRFFLCPEGIIREDDLPDGWGLLYFNGKKVKKIKGFPPNTKWFSSPFKGNKQEENIMLVSALKRFESRNLTKIIYEPSKQACNCNYQYDLI